MSAVSHAVPAVSAEERARAEQYLIATREGLIEAVRGLTAEQWAFKAADEQWSIAGVLEHLAIIEGRVHGLIAKLAEVPDAEPGTENLAMDQIIPEKVPLRTSKVEAPPAAHPAGQCSPQELLQQFLERRSCTIELLQTAAHLRGRVLTHFVFGPWDGYQWILGVAAHSARHTAQILELKSHAGFPAANAADVH